MSYSSPTRTVQVALRDNTRFEYQLAVPNRAGVIKMETLVREGQVRDYTSLAEVGHLTKPRLTQIMNLTNLAPEIQESLLFLPKTVLGPDPITERQMRPVVAAIDWDRQRRLFSDLLHKGQSWR